MYGFGIIKENTGVRYCRTITTTGNFHAQENLYRFNPTVYHLHFDKMMDLAERFITMQTEAPQIFYVWGHAYEMNYASDYWVKLEKFFKRISNCSDIFYGTNSQILL